MHDRRQSRTGWSRLRTASFLAFFAASTAGAVEISPAVTEAYAAMARAHNPFGDGHSARRIADWLALG